jgi:hypothetical protein
MYLSVNRQTSAPVAESRVCPRRCVRHPRPRRHTAPPNPARRPASPILGEGLGPRSLGLTPTSSARRRRLTSARHSPGEPTSARHSAPPPRRGILGEALRGALARVSAPLLGEGLARVWTRGPRGLRGALVRPPLGEATPPTSARHSPILGEAPWRDPHPRRGAIRPASLTRRDTHPRRPCGLPRGPRRHPRRPLPAPRVPHSARRPRRGAAEGLAGPLLGEASSARRWTSRRGSGEALDSLARP